jgi:hypothetical protein
MARHSPAFPGRRSPALALWRGELAAGLRTLTTLDDLWRAASAEQLAEDIEADGVPANAVARRQEAAAIVRRAAAAQQPRDNKTSAVGPPIPIGQLSASSPPAHRQLQPARNKKAGASER